MDFQNIKPVVLGAFVFAAAVALSAPVHAQSLIILAVVGGNPSGDYELCAWNPSADEQDAVFVFQRNQSALATAPERIVLGLAPNETECQIYTPPGAGMLSLRTFPHPDSDTPDVPPDDPSGRAVPTVYTQVWLLQGGLRIAPVATAALCPTPSGVCPGIYQFVGNAPG